MKSDSGATASGDSPATRLRGCIAKYDPAIATVVRAARSRLRKLFPGAVELVYDNYNALAIGFGPTERASDAVVSLAVYPRWVNLYFLHGATLPDPAKLLAGSGNQGRYLQLAGASDLDRMEVRALLHAAIEGARGPMRKAGRGYTVIKAVAGRQRPRRTASVPGPHNKLLQADGGAAVRLRALRARRPSLKSRRS